MKTLIMRALLLEGISAANVQTDREERDITIPIPCKGKAEACEFITEMINEHGVDGVDGVAAFKAAGKKLKAELEAIYI